MKFICEKNSLLNAVSLCSRAVSSKTSMPVLEGLLFNLTDTLEISGYDLNTGIKTNVDVNVIKKGSVVLNAKLLSDILRKLPDYDIIINSDSKMLTTIKCSKTVFTLIGMSADDFPNIPEILKQNKIEIPKKTLKSMINGTIFCVSDNESKPIHTGCLLECNNNKINMAAVDGYRLSVRREEIPDTGLNFKLVIKGSTLKEIERILDETDDTISIYPDKNHALLEINDTVFVTRLLEGQFLDYNNSIPDKSKYRLVINKNNILESLERVSLIVSERLKTPVKLSFEEQILKLSCTTAISKSYDECIIDSNIKNMEIGFNHKYLSDALRACPDDTIFMDLESPIHPIVFTPMCKNQFTYLVLPVRLRETGENNED